MVSYDWTSSAQISLDSGMRKARKVVPITRGERKHGPIPSEVTVPVKEEIRILTCRQTSVSMTFHLGPPLFFRQAASKPHTQTGKLLPFPVRTTDSGQK
jgi:hypothetical protein